MSTSISNAFRSASGTRNKFVAHSKPVEQSGGGDLALADTPEEAFLSSSEALVATPFSLPTVSSSSCVKALEKAMGFGRQALYLEVAVSLAVFASSSTGADRATKRVVEDIYAQAGYDTGIDGKDYKTVRRRIDAGAALYEKLGEEAIFKMASGLRESKAIEAIAKNMLDNYKFTGINAVFEFAGKPVKVGTNKPVIGNQTTVNPFMGSLVMEGATAEDVATATRLQERTDARLAIRPQQALTQKARMAEDDGTMVFAGPLCYTVPSDATREQLMLLSEKLIEYASSLPTAEDLRDQEMHS